MLAKNCEFARFAAHGSVPHVRGVDWHNEIHAVVALKNKANFSNATIGLTILASEGMAVLKIRRLTPVLPEIQRC
jgi:hypothetical protein